MADINLSPKETALIRKAEKDSGKVMFWLLVTALLIVTPLEIYNFYQICHLSEPTRRDFLYPVLVVSIHVILLRRVMKVRACQRLIKKLHDALPKKLA